MAHHRRTVSGEQTILTYSYLNEAADFSLEQAIASEEGSFYNCLSSIVMSAFCLEAYVNHVGMDRFEDWDEWAPPLNKLRRVAEDLDITVHYGRKPFQSIKLTNQFRNWMAHGRTDVLQFSYTERRPSRGKVEHPGARWQEMCTEKNAKRFLEDLEEVVCLIHDRCGYEGPALGVLGYAIWVKRPAT